jgi:hypothetical protein
MVMEGRDPDDEEEDYDPFENTAVGEVIEVFDSQEFLPFVQRLFFLRGVKEVHGFLPNDFLPLTSSELKGLLIIADEIEKQTRKDSLDAERRSQAQSAATAAPTQYKTGRGTTRTVIRGAPPSGMIRKG